MNGSEALGGSRAVAEGNGFAGAPERGGMDLGHLDHDSFRAAVGTLAAYGAILAAMTLLLFGVPFLLFSL